VCGFNVHDEVFSLRVITVVNGLVAARSRGVSSRRCARREEPEGLGYDTRSSESVTRHDLLEEGARGSFPRMVGRDVALDARNHPGSRRYARVVMVCA
jgi:hypothetical protein